MDYLMLMDMNGYFMLVDINGYFMLMYINGYLMLMDINVYLTEGSLEVKLPTIWTDEKQSREEAERRGRLEERRVEEKE